MYYINFHRFRSVQVSIRSFCSNNIIDYEGNQILGITREYYTKWERRAPLSPRHVRELAEKCGYKVLVQPSYRRIFRNEEYKDCGAVLTEDLSPANVILGVKQVPIRYLLPNKTYCFFSHTIKAQDENMMLLDSLLAKNIRLIDYECITDTGERSSGQRLVAFGRFAGLAGMIDIFQALGQNLLAQGYHTPFINSPSTYMYQDLDSAKMGIASLGRQIATHGLIPEICPLIFAFTGKGKVSQGSMEIFRLLPHEFIDPNNLAEFIRHPSADWQRKVYGTSVTEEHMVERRMDLAGDGGPSGFDRAEYREHPERYRPIFHEKVAPYISVLINGVYWDARYPRLLTRSQVKEMSLNKDMRLLAVSDISCDVEGSIEFLSRTTEIERPFLNYRPDTEQTSVEIDGKGIVISGVEILPSELPREASESFGEALMPLLPHLLEPSSSSKGPTSLPLPLSLEGAIITSHGKLSDTYRYIHFLRSEKEREKKLYDRVHGRPDLLQQPPPTLAPPFPHVTLKLLGHLFDSGLINQILDVIENRGGSFHIAECLVKPNIKNQGRQMSTIVMEIEAKSGDIVRDIVQRVKGLANLVETAQASVVELSHQDQAFEQQEQPFSPTSNGVGSSAVKCPHILILGAGRVAGPAIEHLGREGTARRLTIVGGSSEEIRQALARCRNSNVKGLVLDVTNDLPAIRRLLADADIVLSLLPASMHPRIAEECLGGGCHLVTSSYVSDEMASLHKPALSKGLIFLNEMGLDPGLDHASAMKIMDDARSRGGRVTSFRSVCGGLPSPEVAASNNPFLYKFSWSPRAVFTAAQSPARFLENGRVHEVDGDHLLISAQKCNLWPTLRLEVLPNRDSLRYGKLYNISGSATTIFRGTLRYEGWSELMYGCKVLGLFDSVERGSMHSLTWTDVLGQNLGVNVEGDDRDLQLQKACRKRLLDSGAISDANRVIEALTWLGILETGQLMMTSPQKTNIIDSFSALLEERLRYVDGERDMVLMRHDILIDFPSSQEQEHHVSSLLMYGNGRDSAMATTVGLTSALAVELVMEENLEGLKMKKGILTPLIPEIYEPILLKAKDNRIKFDEFVRIKKL